MQQIKAWLKKQQRLLADYLNRKTAGLSGKAWLCLLILFTCGVSAICIHLILTAIL